MKGMQKMKRGTALLLALIMAFGVSFVSTASVQEVQADTVRGIFNKPTEIEELINYGLELRDENQAAFEIYSALRTVTTETKTVEVEFDPPLPIEQNYRDKYLSKALQMAVDAFWMDYPELFWIAGEDENGYSRIQMGYSYSDSKDQQGMDISIVSKVTLTINVPNNYGDLNEAYDAVYQKLTDCISRAEGLSDYEKLKLYHDFLCDELTYDHEYDAPNAYDMYGALIGGECVCEGYAESFKALCDRSGIPCVLVVGTGVTGTRPEDQEPHMWNYCLVDDKWYAVDVTWDDQETQTFHEFFLAGSETKTPHFSPDVFGASHLPNGDFSQFGYHTFTFPKLNSTAYDSGEEPGPADPSEIKEGDVDGDGTIGAGDALKVLQHAAQLIKLEDISYADVDKDGSVTSADALQILQHAAKLIDHFEAVK